MKKIRLSRPIAVLLALSAGAVLLPGCDENGRLARQAEKNAQRQAEQNEEMARVNREIAEGSKRLVQANAESTDKLLTQQDSLDHERGQIDGERRSLADERHRESLLGPALTTLGWLLVCSLPLVLCWYLLHGLRHGDEDAEISRLLVEEIASDRPTLFAGPPHATVIDHEPLSALETIRPPKTEA